jgi:pilus assembly protein CpaE
VRNIGNRTGAPSVALVGLDPTAMGLVREVLAAEAALPPNSLLFPDALAALKRNRPDVVIVGYANTEAALALGQTLQREFPGVTPVALAAKSSADAILNAMRSGYKEFVVLPDDATRLRQAVKGARNAGKEDEVDEDKGIVIAFAGAKGGVGSSTIAANIAAELAGIHRVMLIDLDLSTGDIGSVLDITAKDTVSDVLSRVDRLDERSLTGAAAVHRSKVHALLTPDDPTTIEHVTAEAVVQLVACAASAYQFVLIDCGTYFDEATGVALNVADQVCRVTTPDVVAVRDAFRRLKAWSNLGLDKKRVRLVVNKWSKASFLQLSDIEQNLGLAVSATISEDQRTVDQALNEGKLIRDVNKKADVVRDLTALLSILTDDSPEPSSSVTSSGSSGGKGGFFANLFNRG